MPTTASPSLTTTVRTRAPGGSACRNQARVHAGAERGRRQARASASHPGETFSNRPNSVTISVRMDVEPLLLSDLPATPTGCEQLPLVRPLRALNGLDPGVFRFVTLASPER